VAAGEAGVPEAFIEKLQALPEVRAASPVIEALAETDVAATRLLIVGLDITGDAAMRPWLFRTGEGSAEIDPIAFIAQPDSLLMTRSFAAGHGWVIGSKLGLHAMDGLKAFTIRGLLSDENLEKIFGGNVAVMDVYGAQRVFGRGSSVDRIEIALTEGTALEDGRAAIRRAVGPGYTVEPPSARGEQFEDLVKAYETLEAMACLFAVALGICMIDASFRLAVAQRRTEIGILRSLGATRGQIQSLFMWEGLITGVLGSAFGLALGVHLFAAGTRMAGTMFRTAFGGLADQTQQVHVSPLMMVVAFLAGIGISLVASWLPARDAARANPVEAFRPMYYQRSLPAWQPRALMGSGLLLLGALAGGTQEGSTAAFYTSMVLLFVAVVLAIPTFVLGAVQVLRPLLGRVLGLEATLALDSLADGRHHDRPGAHLRPGGDGGRHQPFHSPDPGDLGGSRVSGGPAPQRIGQPGIPVPAFPAPFRGHPARHSRRGGGRGRAQRARPSAWNAGVDHRGGLRGVCRETRPACDRRKLARDVPQDRP
jgi:putative ABC transport system permease protein